MTVEELSKNQKLYFWYNHYQSLKESGLAVRDYCRINNIKLSTYYDNIRKIKQLLCDEVNSNDLPSVKQTSFIPVPEPVLNDKTILIKGGITITCEPTVTYDELEPILKAMYYAG